MAVPSPFFSVARICEPYPLFMSRILFVVWMQVSDEAGPEQSKVGRVAEWSKKGSYPYAMKKRVFWMKGGENKNMYFQ